MKTKIFNIVSIIFLVSLIILYSVRFIHYYKIEHKVYESNTKLIDVLKDNNSKESYVYSSNANNNYIYYLGRMWRIISVDENINIISDEVDTLLSWNSDEYQETDIYHWLNNKFKNSLKENAYIVNDSIRLLTEDEYNKLSEHNYLNNKTPYWILCDKVCYVEDGKIKEDNEKLLGVRPVISLSSEILYSKGLGTLSNPYEIVSDSIHMLKDTYVGEYVTYSNLLWRVIDKGENKTKLVLESDNELKVSDYQEKLYESLENKDYIVSSSYNVGSYKNSYLDTYNKDVELNIGTLTIGDFYINSNPNTYTMTPYAYSSKSFYVINSKNLLYIDIDTSKYNVRPTIYLDDNLFIVSGDGTSKNAYKVGR